MRNCRYATHEAPSGCAPNARHRPRRPVLRLSLVVCAAALLASCGQQGVLDPQGPIASAQLLLLINAAEIMLVVVVPVIVATLGFAWWYRSSNAGARRREDLAYEGRVDFVVWSIPLLVVILLGGVNWISSHALDPREPIAANAKPLEVEVVALDWKWLFIYPEEGIASLNQLVIPVGTPLRFRLTSATVMSSFLVPQLGSQIYTMPGMTTQLNLLADRPGEFPGFSANLRQRLCRHAVHRQSGARRRFRRLGRSGTRLGTGARHSRLCRISEAEPSRAADDLSLGRPRTVRAHYPADDAGPRRRAHRRRVLFAGCARGGLRCWAT